MIDATDMTTLVDELKAMGTRDQKEVLRSLIPRVVAVVACQPGSAAKCRPKAARSDHVSGSAARR